ncbi:MAG: hypothetical protein LBE12_15465 [Planctomycetaceae bacterium]|nr:hypothetical protein [Planctomycetaceae bacterium]
MRKQLENLVYGLSFGERYLVASLVYLGLSLMLIASMPEMKMALASDGECTHTVTVTDENGTHDEEVPGCPDGQTCCGGTCIGSGQGCCNGTVYDTATQGCCNNQVYDLATQGCCGGNTYNKETEKCCCASCVKLKEECCCECEGCDECTNDE